MVAAAVASEEAVRTGYQEFRRIEDPDGILAIISYRVSGPPLVTIAIYKVFPRDGQVTKTSFWSVRQLEAVKRVVGIAGELAQAEEDRQRTEYEANGNRRR